VESLELYLPVGQTFNLTVDVGHTFYVGDLKTLSAEEIIQKK
jgi:filamentous hemagglutinin